MREIKEYNLILCEGETDQALIGSFLECTEKWRYKREVKETPFVGESIVWYENTSQKYLGIWSVGGDDFTRVIESIAGREKYEHGLRCMAVVTDHDDENAERERAERTFSKLLDFFPEAREGIDAVVRAQNTWHNVCLKNVFGQSKVKMCYILIPADDTGALETFMLKALSENDSEQENVICQAKTFVREFKSNKYLQSRREKVKAELGVSLSVFSPDKVFTTMKELIDSVDWSKFELSKQQFQRLREIG